ncbi:MAG: glycosyltransferase family 4 protein [Desulfocapsa sp.]|nr:glycosyltransferase family 4 protein [Desulfocapsa sp.]
MAKHLVERGHQVTMVCGSYGGGKSGLNNTFVRGVRRGQIDGIDLIELELPYSNHDGFIKRSAIFIKFAVKSTFIVLREPCDLIFTTSTPLTAGIPGIVAKYIRNKPFVFEVRDLWPELPRAMGVIRNPVALGLMDLLERVSYRAANGCIGLSPGIVEGIRKKSNAEKAISMIPNGSDLELFDPGNSEEWRPEEVRSDDFMAVFTGAHGIANGLDSVLDAACVLRQRKNDSIKFVFIGDGKLKQTLKKRAQREELRNCLFLDPVPKQKLAKLLQGADAGLMILADIPAFYYGTSPNKFFDYIAAGLPVVNNYPGWLAEIIEKNKCGVVVEPGNAEKFADILENLAANKNDLLTMGRNARMLAVKEFSRKKLARSFVDYLEEIAGENKSEAHI